MKNIGLPYDLYETKEIKPIELQVLPSENICCRYGCCGNCRYFDGDEWCGLHRTRTTGGDSCGSWRDEDD